MLSKSFTLIETAVAIFVLTVGILTVSSLISYLLSISSIASQKLIASYLAQEGIEIVRNIRDTNLLNNDRNWDYGLNDGDWQGDYNDSSLTRHDASFLNLENSGFYGYDDGAQTPFKRRIHIGEIVDQKGEKIGIKVEVEVSWRERGRTHSVKAQENLYNWQQ